MLMLVRGRLWFSHLWDGPGSLKVALIPKKGVIVQFEHVPENNTFLVTIQWQTLVALIISQGTKDTLKSNEAWRDIMHQINH